jgi:hypothetical protein
MNRSIGEPVVPARTKQRFIEPWTCTYTLNTPIDVTRQRAFSQFGAGPWKFETEIAIDVEGRILDIEILGSEVGDDETVWTVQVDFELCLMPWDYLEPAHYSRSDTLGMTWAHPQLPALWEIIEIQRG